MKILLLSAATGGGHLRAAHAIEEYISQHTEHEAVLVDALKAAGRLLDKTVCDSYLFMARKTPALFGKLYRQTNKQNHFSNLVPKLNGKFSRLLLPTIQAHAPDVVISTHPFVTEMTAELKADGLLSAPLICVITDYGVHRAYIAPQVDAYIVACEDMVEELKGYGVAPEKIYPLGIPVHSVFFSRGDKAALRQSLGLDPDLPTVLFMAGSFGVSNIMKLYKDLENIPSKIQLIVITGKNKRLYEAFEKSVAENAPVPTKLVYFTKEVETYMHASDLLVTKPGGLTVSEALASGLPMAVFDAIPGQEEDNASFLAAHNMCIRLGKGEDIVSQLSALLGDKPRLSSMRESCERFDKSQCIPQMLSLMGTLAL